VHTSSRVLGTADDFSPSIQLSTGKWIHGDLVIAADGIRSTIRGQIARSHDHIDKASPTGDSAYRILIPREKLEHDQNALKLLEQNIGMRWMGPGGHVMAYPIKNNQVYNMVLLHPQKPNQTDVESWTIKGDKKEMMKFYEHWNPLLKSLLSYVPDGEVMEWTLNSHAPLPSWHQNKVMLIGDAVHPMLPYVAQGAAQAIEDAGAIVAALTQTDDVELAIAVYEQVRKDRGETVQSSAAQVRKALHLPDGPEQQARDKKIRAASQGVGKNPDLWADTGFQEFVWGTDIMKIVCEDWDEWESKTKGHHIHDVAALVY
jgi:salicylate hydroxylase